MIIEMLLKLTEKKILVAAWEFPTSLTENKKASTLKFIRDVLFSQEIESQQKEWQGNIIFEINAKPHQFYDIQNNFNDYFKTIGATILVN